MVLLVLRLFPFPLYCFLCFSLHSYGAQPYEIIGSPARTGFFLFSTANESQNSLDFVFYRMHMHKKYFESLYASGKIFILRPVEHTIRMQVKFCENRDRLHGKMCKACMQ